MIQQTRSLHPALHSERRFFPVHKEFCDRGERGLVHNAIAEINALPTDRFLHRLIARWVRYERALTFASMTEQDVLNPVIIALEEKGEAVALAQFPRTEFLSFSPKFVPLPETIQAIADKEGYSPDVDWFERRKTRLRITESDEFDSFMVPAASIPELIVSYALSTAGKVSINEEMVEDRYNRFKEAYRKLL